MRIAIMEAMKTIIFSDSHLTKTFDEKKFQFLKKLILSADRIIINGDFWEGFTMTLDEFLKTDWKALLQLLGTKETIYVVGNHDEQAKNMQRYFPHIKIVNDRYVFHEGGKRYIVQHGHQYNLTFQRYVPVNLEANPTSFAWLVYTYMYLESFFIRTIFKWPLQMTYRIFNAELKRAIKKEAKRNDIFIFGHTHSPELDIKHQFANSGIVRHGVGQYLELTEKGLVSKEIWYEPRNKLFSLSKKGF